MTDIFGILNLNPDIICKFEDQGRVVQDNVGVERILNNAAKQLKDIEKRVAISSARPEFSPNIVADIIEKMKEDATTGGYTWTSSELRIVSYYMMRFQNSSSQFLYALKTLEKNWRNIYLNGLAFFLLNSWTTCSEQIKNACIDLFRRRLLEYDGSLPKYIKLKNHIDFFDEAGPMRMASLLSVKNIPLSEAPVLIGFSTSNISLTYFSEVILNYIKKQNSSIEEIEKIFSYHTLDRTKKLAMAYLIEKSEQSGNSVEQNLVTKAARRVMGYDITLETTWASFTGATIEETSLLKRAHDLVTAWYARKSVETFFEIACQDKDRRNFWLKYIENVRDFRIVGSLSIKNSLAADGRINDALGSCFISTNSRYSQTAALVLYFEDKVFVEFSDTGALYVYNTNRKEISNLKRIKTVEKTDSLKIPSLNVLVEQEIGNWGNKWYRHYEEGRLVHNGYWQDRLSSWFKEVMHLRPEEKKYKLVTNDRRAIQSNSSSIKVENKESSKQYLQPSLFDEDSLNDNNTKKADKNIAKPQEKQDTLSVILSSKSIADHRIRVVAASAGYFASAGYYIYDMTKNQYHLISHPLKSQIGNIWIRRPNDNGERQVVHAFRGTEYVIGYIMEFSDHITFAKDRYSKLTLIYF